MNAADVGDLISFRFSLTMYRLHLGSSHIKTNLNILKHADRINKPPREALSTSLSSRKENKARNTFDN